MKTETAIFRIKKDHDRDWSWLMTRNDIICKLEKSCIKRSYNWPYTIKDGQIKTVKNSVGKVLQVKRDVSENLKKSGDFPDGKAWPLYYWYKCPKCGKKGAYKYGCDLESKTYRCIYCEDMFPAKLEGEILIELH